jgi:ankyrin repeat protein
VLFVESRTPNSLSVIGSTFQGRLTMAAATSSSDESESIGSMDDDEENARDEGERVLRALFGSIEDDFRSFEEGFQDGGDLRVAVLPGWIDERPHLAHATDRHGQTLLHHAASLAGCSARVLRCIHKRFPHMVSTVSRRGHLPLHELFQPGTGLREVKVLVEAHPQALQERDCVGYLPLHRALYWRVDPSVVRYLANRWPPAVQHKLANGHFGDLPIHLAAHFARDPGYFRLVEYLAKRWPESLGEASGNGCVPLHRVVQQGAPPSTIKRLVKLFPAALHIADENGCLPLHCDVPWSLRSALSDEARVERARILIRRWPQALRVESHDGKLPMHWVAQRGSVALAQLFVRSFPESLRATDDDGYLPLHRAAAAARSPGKARFLLEEWPRSARETTNDGLTPLHVAAQFEPDPESGQHSARCRVDTVRVLLRAWPGAVRARANDGSLPLHCAAPAAGAFETVRRLVEAHPASVRAVNQDGLTPLHRAFQADDGEYSEDNRHGRWLADRAPVLEHLIQMRPESLRQPCKYGLLPAHYAAIWTQSLFTLQLVVERWPAALGVPSLDGSLPIHRAVGRDDPPLQLVQFLVQQKPTSLLIPAVDGSLPLHAALESFQEPRPDVVRYLVEQCPDALGVANAAGSLPLHVALSRCRRRLRRCCRCSLDIVKMLVEPRPEALQVADREGWFPFQRAAASGAPLDVVYYLVATWPEGATKPRRRGGMAKAEGTDSSARKRKRDLEWFEI